MKLANFLKNIAPHSTDPLRRTPYEQLFGKKPSIQRLRPFGILGHVHIPVEARKAGTKLLHRSEQGIFVGYGHSTWTSRLYIPQRHVIVQSQDVTFAAPVPQIFRPIRDYGIDPAPGHPANDQNIDAWRPRELVTTLPPIKVHDDAEPGDIGDLPSAPQTPTLKSRATSLLQNFLSSPDRLSNHPPTATAQDAPSLGSPSSRTSDPPHKRSRTSESSTSSRGAITRIRRQTRMPERYQGTYASARPFLTTHEEDALAYACLFSTTFSAAATLMDTPRTYAEATSDAYASLWRPAIEKEIANHADNGTWKVVPQHEIPSGTKLVGTRWVFDTKQDESGNIVKRKARLVAQGFSQRHGFDYDDTYSPVVRYDSLRILLVLAAVNR